MRPRQLLPLFILLASVACTPYADYAGPSPFAIDFGYQSPTPYYYYPYYSNPHGYYYYPHPQRHGEWLGHRGGGHRGTSGHSGGRGASGRGGRH
jgi:hypothetical protein